MTYVNHLFKVFLKVVVLLYCGNAFLWAHSNLSSGDSGETGSPLDGAGNTCLSCHTATSTSNPASGITFSGISGTTYTPGTTYSMTLALTGATGKNGFEATAENATSKVGTFVAGTNDKVLNTHWIGHSNASVTTWSFSYVAPAAGAGNICFYIIVMENSKGQSGPEWLNSFCYMEAGAGPPTITAQPANQTVAVGATGTFTVTASGNGLTYQWQKAPAGSSSYVAVPAATSASYTTPATVIGDSGSQFRCVVTNSGGSVTSNAATLTVNSTAPTITTQPVSTSVFVGATATFSLTATGAPAPTYQWESAPSGSSSYTNVAGATGNSYTTPATTTADNGTTFKCIVTNPGGTVTSNAATLTVTVAAPAVNTQPLNQSVVVGQAATFSMTASGTPPLSYQWELAPSGSASYSPVAGATSNSYTTPATVVGDNGKTFKCVVTNSGGTATSNAATLNVTASAVPPTITLQPSNQSVTAGAAATFTTAASGTAPLLSQWQSSPSGSNAFTNISGATSASFTIPITVLSDNGSKFQCVITNTAGTVTSVAVTLTVSAAPPSVITQPVSQTVTVGSTATFTVAASGTAPLTYQWQKTLFSSGTYVNIPGATSNSYTTPATLISDNGSLFFCVVTNPGGTVTSSSATLSVNAVAPTITSQPLAASVTTPQTATFSVAVSGTAPLSYQWQESLPGSSTFNSIVGATAASYTTPPTSASDNGKNFQCLISNSGGTVTSSTALLTVTTPPALPVIVTQPIDVRIANGQTATFTVAVANVTDPTLTYLWYRNDSVIPANFNGGPTYTLNVVTPSDNGARFYCLISNILGSVTSNTAQLLVAEPLVAPQISNLKASMSVMDSLEIGTQYSLPVTYAWTFTKIGGAGGFPLIVPSGSGARALPAAINASVPSATLPLSSLNLEPGDYQFSVNATDSYGNTSPNTTGTVTLLPANFSQMRVYPNPWRSDRDGPIPGIMFDRLAPATTLKIFTISGRHVRTLDAPAGTVIWDFKNRLGELVASGIYVFYVLDASRQKSHGKLAIIR